jgi:hypothetical protein
MLEGSEDDSKRREVQADLRRLYLVVLDRLEQDSRSRLLDPREVRLLSANVLRSIRLYMRSMGWGSIRRSKKSDHDSSVARNRWIERRSDHS